MNALKYFQFQNVVFIMSYNLQMSVTTRYPFNQQRVDFLNSSSAPVTSVTDARHAQNRFYIAWEWILHLVETYIQQ